ncbi:MAG TPA: GNVR domain-containing protein, partial [Candidatus Polarisedimenticolia bacterium]|nr:GNVR domain-containing protein [Candidatus Polarisedimenticolia bacterium]
VKIRDHNREIERVKNQIADYESRVANAPRNEQMLLTLKRDYDIMQQSYLDLLKNKTQAVMAENLEQERQGEQFVVLDRAVPPVRPYKPNVQQIIAMGSAFGLFIGIGIALLFDIVRPRFRTEDELAAAYGIPVLVSIPAVVTGDETPWFSRHRKWIFGGMLVIFTGLVAVVYGALAG